MADNYCKVEWSEAKAPDIENGVDSGRLRMCSGCGSMHPSDVANAIKAGAVGSFADWKYGYPHKAYFRHIPNPHAGLLEIRSRANFEQNGYERVAHARYSQFTGDRVDDYVEWVKKSEAPATTDGKFYTVHLTDASEEEREIIERHLGLSLNFTSDGKVSWEPANG